jgi:blue copper oxidase
MHPVSAGRYRLRLVNGSNARIFRLGFSDGRSFRVIAGDGGLLDRPYEVTDVYLAPAERVEIVVDFSDLAAGASVVLRSLQFGTASTPGQQGFALDVMTFAGTGRDGYRGALPAQLVALERYDRSQATGAQTFALDTSPIPIGGHHHQINGVVFDMHRIDARVPLGRLELWELRNDHTMPHPIHIHGTQFQVVERDGAPPTSPHELGWKDTVLVRGRETVQVLVRFQPYAGTYLLHCHNLEHEDDGMMINFSVDAPTGVDTIHALPTELDLR